MADNPVLPSYIIPNQPDPAAAVRSNVELAIGLGQRQQQQQLHNLQMQEIQQKLGQQQLAQQQQQDFYQRMGETTKNPTADNIADLMGMPGALPHYKELKERHDLLDTKEQNQIKSTLIQAFSAGDQGRYDIASKLMQDTSDAFKNVGNQPKADMYAKYAQQYADPAQRGLAQTTIGMSANALIPDFTKMFGENKAQPVKLAKDVVDLNTSKDTLEHAGQVRSAALAKSRAETNSAQSTADKNLEDTKEKKGLYSGELQRSGYKTTEEQNAAAISNITFDNERRKQAAALKEAEAKAKKEADTAPTAGPLAKTELAQKTLDLNKGYDQAPVQLQSLKEELEQSKLKTNELRFTSDRLPTAVAEKVDKQTTDATDAQRAASRVHDLRSRIQQLQAGPTASGLPARAMDFLNSAAGSEGDYQVVQSLYRQAIGEKDLENASSHGAAAQIKLKASEFPSPYASRKLLDPILADLQEYYQNKAEVANIRADYTSKNFNTGPATRPFVAGGRIVNKGDKLRDIIDRPLPPKSELDNARKLMNELKGTPSAKALEEFYRKKGIALNG